MSLPMWRQLGREVLRLTEAQPLRGRSYPASYGLPNTRLFSFRASLREPPTSKPSRPTPTSTRRPRSFPLLAASGSVGLGLLALFSVVQQSDSDTAPPEPPPDTKRSPARSPAISISKAHADNRLPLYRLAEVKEHHGPKSERPWVVYGDKIYDITDWVPAHPGGEVILRAAGGSVEPYWDIFSIHKSSSYVREILEQYVVGRIDPADLGENGRPLQDTIEDPFVSDPARDSRLRKITEKPCNAETPGDELADAFLTPNEVFYVRNHMWVPLVKEAEGDDHGITVELPNGDARMYTVRELKERFKQHAVTAVLQCSGNRRDDMTRLAKKTNGLQWTVGAISCAKWEGVRLRDVLADAGLSLADPGEDAQHVQFSGLEAYGASIPISSALDPQGDVLLAFRMNDEALPRDHGFPVRVIVPGHVAARCVKWVNKIVVSDEESTTSWQRRDYKSFGPNETTQDWDKYKSIQIVPVTSAITRTQLLFSDNNSNNPVSGGQQLERQQQQQPQHIVRLEGYAYSGGGREIQRVDVSLDGGETWDQARLVGEDTMLEKGSSGKAWCWKRWRYQGALPAPAAAPGGRTTFVVKATDDAYNTQPETQRSIYNLRGNLATAWHRVDFTCPPSRSEPGDGGGKLAQVPGSKLRKTEK